MLPAPKRLAFFLAAALFCAPSARALVIYGSGPGDVNNALNTATPANGAPWANVVRFGANNASGIYLGHGFILTANHVNLVDTGLVIDGVSYNRDTTFVPVHVSEDSPATAGYVDVVDLKLVKILGNPGLPPLPVVQSLPLNFSTTSDLNAASTLIGWGVGKGAIITNRGWNWGDSSTYAQRWGTNTTSTTAAISTYDTLHYEALETSFKRALGSDTAQITLGDSGGGLFQQISGTWKLSGLATSTVGYLAEAALYDGQTPVPPGDQPDDSQFVRLARYGHLLRYENWASAKLGNPAALTTADLDNDGVKNLLEYALHADPSVAAVAALPQAGVESGFVTLTYTQLMSATDLSYVVEESPDLAGWLPATVLEEVVSTSGVTRIVKAKVALGAATQKFLRLSVTKLP